MTTLVVQAHPLDDSYSAALMHAVVEGLHDQRVVRICQGDELSAASFEDVTSLVAVYPTWWGSLPAELLAAMNTVVGPWIDGPEPAETSPLVGVRAVTVVTTHGSSKFVNRLQGEPGLDLWKRTIMPLCEPGARFSWHALYRLDRATLADRKEFVEQTRAAIR